MEEELKLIIKPLVDKRSGEISLLDFDTLSNNCDLFIKANSVFSNPNPNDAGEMKICKQERTALNKAKTNIKNARLQIVDCLTGEFSEQCKELEKKLDEASAKHTEAINNAKKLDQPTEEKPKGGYRLLITTEDKDIYEAIMNYALRKGAHVE